MLRNVLLVGVSLLVGLAICEGLLRRFSAPRLPSSDLYELDPDTGKRMRAGWQGHEFGVEVRISSLSLRNPETTYAKPPGRYRILVLGDSWTFGFRVAEPDSYPRQLERVLNERARDRGEPARFEVINAGVIGYATTQEAAYLRARGRRFKPDLVLVAYYPVNDTDLKHEKYARYNRLRAIHPWLLELYRLPRRLHLRQFVKGADRALRERWQQTRGRLFAARRSEAAGLPDVGAPPPASDWTQDHVEGGRGWKAARGALHEIGRITQELHARGLVVLLPDLEDLARYIDRDHPRVEPLVRAATRDAGLDYYDMLESFAAYRERELELRDPGYRHPNAAGYRVLATSLADQIEARFLGHGARGVTRRRPQGRRRRGRARSRPGWRAARRRAELRARAGSPRTAAAYADPRSEP